MNKAETIATAQAMGLHLAGNETKAEIEDMIEAANDVPADPASEAVPVVRRKVNRGSTRRIVVAHEAFDKALGAFIAEIDAQVFESVETDKDGVPVRSGEWPFVTDLRRMREVVREAINGVVTQ